MFYNVAPCWRRAQPWKSRPTFQESSIRFYKDNMSQNEKWNELYVTAHCSEGVMQPWERSAPYVGNWETDSVAVAGRCWMLLNFSFRGSSLVAMAARDEIDCVTGDWRPIRSIKPAGHSSLSTKGYNTVYSLQVSISLTFMCLNPLPSTHSHH